MQSNWEGGYMHVDIYFTTIVLMLSMVWNENTKSQNLVTTVMFPGRFHHCTLAYKDIGSIL